MQPIDSPAVHGGAAPTDRQCQFTKSDGFRCRDWALRGHDHCFRHRQYLEASPQNPIDVPLLEDEDSLASLLSQTLRALAWGTIPAVNGRAILAGCRIMQGILTHRLATAKFHARLRQLGITEVEDELFDNQPPAQPEIEPASAPVTCNPSSVTSNPSPAPCNSTPVVSNSAPATCNQSPVPSKSSPVTRNSSTVTSPRFPNLAKEWDRDLLRSEEEMMKLRFPRRDPAPNPFVIPRNVPFTAATPEEIADLVASHGR